MRRLSDKLAGRMRNEGISGRTITVKVRYTGFITISRSSTSPFVFHNAEEIFEEAMRLAKPELEGAVRLLGIRIGNLCGREGEQLRLFGGENRSKIERLEMALDEITSKFGDGSIERAKNISKSKED